MGTLMWRGPVGAAKLGAGRPQNSQPPRGAVDKTARGGGARGVEEQRSSGAKRKSKLASIHSSNPCRQIISESEMGDPKRHPEMVRTVSIAFLLLSIGSRPCINCLDSTCEKRDGQEYCSINSPLSDQDGGRLNHAREFYQQHHGGHEERFKAAVVEYNRIDLDTCHESVEANLKALEKILRSAAEHGVQLLVFPEDGLFIGEESYVVPCLEEIPDPEADSTFEIVPCQHEDENSTATPTLRRLSCLAKTYALYLVANFGTRQSCEPGQQVGERLCPEKGFLRLNTDVVFDDRGRFIRRYRKYNPFIEVFEKPPGPEHVYFDTPWGRFGLFTCFDILFKRPAIELVEEYEINTVIFPTWWYDELPILTALQIQDAWSLSNKVNLLGANILRPALGSTGSGIFCGNSSVYVGPGNDRTKLIMAAGVNSKTQFDCNLSPEILSFDESQTKEMYTYKNWTTQGMDVLWRFDKMAVTTSVCHNGVCCYVDYELDEETRTEARDKMVLIIRDANREGHFRWWEQVCALATLVRPTNTTFATGPILSFKRLSLRAVFKTRHVFPYAAHGVNRLVDRHRRQFSCNYLKFFDETGDIYGGKVMDCNLTLIVEPDERVSIYSIGLYGRPYEYDIMPP